MKLSHLQRMTDSTGAFQHAAFSVPNFSEGYCTDDNARALIVITLLGLAAIVLPCAILAVSVWRSTGHGSS